MLCSHKLFGQGINLRIKHITSDQGLSQNTVGSILKDRKGFLWFGTWNGLNRYDGYNLTVFKSDNNKNNLSNNFIYALNQDNEGDIWIGTKNGLNQLIYSKNRFKRYFHDPRNNNSISNNQVNSVLCDRRGRIWIGTNDGLDLLIRKGSDTLNMVFRHYKHDARNLNSLPGNKINTITEDKYGNIWVGTTDGLAKLNAVTGLSVNYYKRSNDNTSLSGNNVLSVYEDHRGNIWVGTELGLNKFDAITHLFKHYLANPDNPKSIAHLVINSIKEDSKGTLLIGTLGGLNKYDEEADNFDCMPVNGSDYGFNNEFINTINTDSQGNVWVGTDKGGVNTYNIYQKEFGYIGYDPKKAKTLNNSTVNSILEESSYLWIGTAGGGLNCLNRKTGQFKYYTSTTHSSHNLPNNYVSCILRDQKQNLWICTWGGGISKLVSMEGSGKFENYSMIPSPLNSNDEFVSSLCEDKNGIFIVGALSGVRLFSPDKRQIIPITLDRTIPFKITEVGCVLKDRKGNYWIGTRTGLFWINGKKISQTITRSDIIKYVNIPNDSTSLPGNYIISLCQDRNGMVWIGTYGNGICKVDIGKGNKISFENYTSKQGLSNNVVYSILDDKFGNLWLSTDCGLSRFDIHTHLFRNFYVTDGLQNNQFYWSAAYKSGDGKMYFGGINGLNYFYPESIKSYTALPSVAITDFKIFNNSVPVGLWNNKRIILTQNISLTDEIRLTYKENVFSLEFSALDYFLPDKVLYAYKMEGVDKDWVYVTSNRRFANYTNLKGGSYNFLVKACNSDGIWNPIPTCIRIIISPPFWETIWFRIVIGLLLIAIITGYFRIKTKRLHARRVVLEQQVKVRTAQIEEQKEELRSQTDRLADTNSQLAKRQAQVEKQKLELELKNVEISNQRDELIELNKRVELVNQLKLRFFTNISHEFRTPLTLILGALEKLATIHPEDIETHHPISLAQRSAQRLLHLINQLMEFRKIETGKLELNISQGEIHSYIENIFASFDYLAQQRKISYTLSIDAPQEETWFDQEKIENIIYNLISNAFKYTPEGGRISVSVTHSSDVLSFNNDEIGDCKMLEIRVSDSGIGIPQEHLNDIFKQFFRVNNQENLKIQGSGIGLSLTRSLIRTHHGTIHVDSTQGLGTTFVIKFPYAKEQYKTNEIVTVQDELKISDFLPVDHLTEELIALSGNERPVDKFEKSDKRPLLLVVEDNYDLRSFIATGLNDDYRVMEADNGKEGYQIAKAQALDLIISDIMMPEMDGLELCSRLKEDLATSHIPVILLTARSSIENRIEGLETGADDYVPKPFSFSLLKARIANLIENRNRLRKIFSRELSVSPRQITTSVADLKFLDKAMKIVEENFSNSDFGVEEFIYKIGVSRSLLHKKLTTITELSAGDFITSVRLKESTKLLKLKMGNISEIAYAVGFNDPKYFSRIFRKNFGMSPKEFAISSERLEDGNVKANG